MSIQTYNEKENNISVQECVYLNLQWKRKKKHICVPVSIQMYVGKVLYISQYKYALRIRYLDIAIRLNGCYCHFSMVAATECPHIYVTDKTPKYTCNPQHTTHYLEVNIIPVCIIVKLIITPQGRECSDRYGVREKYLCSCIYPNLHWEKY